jgi:hypothetical protein
MTIKKMSARDFYGIPSDIPCNDPNRNPVDEYKARLATQAAAYRANPPEFKYYVIFDREGRPVELVKYNRSAFVQHSLKSGQLMMRVPVIIGQQVESGKRALSNIRMQNGQIYY